MLKAIIVDDENLSIKRLGNLLHKSGEIEICHSFLNPWEAYEYVRVHPIHLAFLDISLPEMNGMRLSGLLLEIDPTIDVIFVTGYDEYAVQAFELSALDYLMKPVNENRLSKTLEKIKKRRPNTLGTSSNAVPILPEVEPRSNDMLTKQEIRIVYFITEGLSNKEIANQLNITVETVKYHIKNVYRKLQVNNRVMALKRAKELHIIV